MNFLKLSFYDYHRESFEMIASFSRVLINSDGIKGIVEFTQRSPFDPTWVNFQLGASDEDYESNLRFVGSMLQYNIKELPPRLLEADQWEHMCNTTGRIFNPTNIEEKDIPPPGE